MTNHDPAILDKFGHHMGRKPIYPWDEWTDGKIRELVQGIDFESEVTSFRVLIHRTARNRGLKARTRYSGLFLQGVSMARFQVKVTTQQPDGDTRFSQDYTLEEFSHDNANVNAAITALRNFKEQKLARFPYEDDTLTVVVSELE